MQSDRPMRNAFEEHIPSAVSLRAANSATGLTSRKAVHRQLLLCCSIFSLLITGCATDQSSQGPSLLQKLSGSEQNPEAHYMAAADTELGTKKVKDPLFLKLKFAQVMEEFENYPIARENYGIVLKEQPENFEAIIGLARVDQAVGQTGPAEAGFRHALKLKPNSAAAQHALGQFLLAQGQLNDALPLLNQALLAQPNNKAYRYHLAVALAKSGDINAALPHFKRTVGEAAAHHNIATVLRDTGDVRGAEQHFRQALSIQPDLEESRQALSALYQQRNERLANVPDSGSVIQSTPNRTLIQTHHQVTDAQAMDQMQLDPSPVQQQFAR